MKTGAKLLAALVAVGLLVGCSTQMTKKEIAEEQAEINEMRAKAEKQKMEYQQEQMEKELDAMPAWVTEPPRADSDGFYGVGIGKDKDLLNSVRKAKLQAQFDMAKTMRSELSGEDTMTGSGTGQYRYVINNFVNKVNLSGSEVIQQEIKPMNGEYTTYILMRLDFNQFDQLMARQKMEPDEQKTLEDSYARLMNRIGEGNAPAN